MSSNRLIFYVRELRVQARDCYTQKEDERTSLCEMKSRLVIIMEGEVELQERVIENRVLLSPLCVPLFLRDVLCVLPSANVLSNCVSPSPAYQSPATVP